MIKELVLVPRVLYGVFFTLGGLYVAFASTMHPKSFIGAFLFMFLFSFVWQYYVLHFALKTANNKQRAIGLIVWLIVSCVVGAWGLNELGTFDWLQNESTLMNDFAWRMTVYLIGASMYIGGVCTRRAYEKHGAL